MLAEGLSTKTHCLMKETIGKHQKDVIPATDNKLFSLSLVMD